MGSRELWTLSLVKILTQYPIHKYRVLGSLKEHGSKQVPELEQDPNQGLRLHKRDKLV